MTDGQIKVGAKREAQPGTVSRGCEQLPGRNGRALTDGWHRYQRADPEVSAAAYCLAVAIPAKPAGLTPTTTRPAPVAAMAAAALSFIFLLLEAASYCTLPLKISLKGR
jgi:hypothetical protein